MAELTKLESKLAEVLGLAMAGRAATERVQILLGDGDSGLAATLAKMNQEASETATRCLGVAANFERKKSAIQTRPDPQGKRAPQCSSHTSIPTPTHSTAGSS